jgi:uncharacterized protein
MSKANVDVVRPIHDGWARGDFGAWQHIISTDFEFQQRRDAVEPGTLHGAAVGGAVRKIFEVYADYRIEAEEYIDAGEKVVVVGRKRGIARASGMQLDAPEGYVWTVRGGAVVRLEVYPDGHEALAAVGLRE